MSKHKKATRTAAVIFAILIIPSMIGLAVTGASIGWGPFKGLFWTNEVRRVRNAYSPEEHQNGIVFYGASNFRLWTEMENDLADYRVVNAGFGGSTDRLMVRYADQLLYPYHPRVVFLQTGSNDYVEMDGTEEEKISGCMEYKKKMIAAFHDELPDAKFVIMSGLILPGRSEYTSLTQQINQELAEYAASLDYVEFVDATEMTYDGSKYKIELFRDDGIHLNHDGQLLWCNDYIVPEIESLITEYPDLESLRT